MINDPVRMPLTMKNGIKMNTYETRKSCNKEIFLYITRIRRRIVNVNVIVVYNFPKF